MEYLLENFISFATRIKVSMFDMIELLVTELCWITSYIGVRSYKFFEKFGSVFIYEISVVFRK